MKTSCCVITCSRLTHINTEPKHAIAAKVIQHSYEAPIRKLAIFTKNPTCGRPLNLQL